MLMLPGGGCESTEYAKRLLCPRNVPDIGAPSLGVPRVNKDVTTVRFLKPVYEGDEIIVTVQRACIHGMRAAVSSSQFVGLHADPIR